MESKRSRNSRDRCVVLTNFVINKLLLGIVIALSYAVYNQHNILFNQNERLGRLEMVLESYLSDSNPSEMDDNEMSRPNQVSSKINSIKYDTESDVISFSDANDGEDVDDDGVDDGDYAGDHQGEIEFVPLDEKKKDEENQRSARFKREVLDKLSHRRKKCRERCRRQTGKSKSKCREDCKKDHSKFRKTRQRYQKRQNTQPEVAQSTLVPVATTLTPTQSSSERKEERKKNRLESRSKIMNMDGECSHGKEKESADIGQQTVTTLHNMVWCPSKKRINSTYMEFKTEHNGSILIKKTGIYLVYASVTYNTSLSSRSYSMYTDGEREILECVHNIPRYRPRTNTTTSSTCSADVHLLLRKNTKIFMLDTQFHGNNGIVTDIVSNRDKSYWGMIWLGGVNGHS